MCITGCQVCGDIVMYITGCQVCCWYFGFMCGQYFYVHNISFSTCCDIVMDITGPFPGYVCDIVMYITITEKRYVIGIWCEFVLGLCVVNIFMYITLLFHMLWHCYGYNRPFPGYVCDIVMYITSTEKKVCDWYLVWICDQNWYVHNICFFDMFVTLLCI